MHFEHYRAALAAIGREISPAALMATRNLVTHLHGLTPAGDINVIRDLAYGPYERNRLDIFSAAIDPDTSRPVLVFVHGGGFIAGDKHTEGSPFYSNIGQWAVRNGFNAVTITYRLAPKDQWPSGVEDLRLLVDFLQRNGAALGIDASRLFLMGQSAGAAHIASYIAHSNLYAPKTAGVRGVILLSGIYDFAAMPPSPMESAYLGADRSVYPSRSSLAGLAATDVPLMVTLAEYDPPHFEQQALVLLDAVQRSKGRLPRFVHALGQNHLSVALYLGLSGDLVGSQIKSFVDEHQKTDASQSCSP
jgi:triacylglycerol lipase